VGFPCFMRAHGKQKRRNPPGDVTWRVLGVPCGVMVRPAGLGLGHEPRALSRRGAHFMSVDYVKNETTVNEFP
jgi:hypothetical protein